MRVVALRTLGQRTEEGVLEEVTSELSLEDETRSVKVGSTFEHLELKDKLEVNTGMWCVVICVYVVWCGVVCV